VLMGEQDGLEPLLGPERQAGAERTGIYRQDIVDQQAGEPRAP